MTTHLLNATAAPAHEQLQFMLDRLGGEPIERGGTYSVCCPAHEDTHPSLDLTVRDGNLLMCCRVGCKNNEILQALGLSWSQVFRASSGNDDGHHKGNTNGHAKPRPKPKAKSKPPRGPVIATYSYEDENRVVRHQTTRHDPKDFRQRRPDGKGGWLNNLNGIPLLLYKLPELLAAAQDRIIFVNEGEKDVETLFGLGLLATTNPMGAEKFSGVDPDVVRLVFAGRRVVVIPDNDAAGERHALQVAEILYGIAAEVRIVRLPDLPAKGDATDWLNGGGTVEQLRELVRQAPVWTPPAKDVEADTCFAASSAPPGDPVYNGCGGDEHGAPPPVADEAEGEAEESRASAHLTDLGNAMRLVRHHGNEFHYCFPWKNYLVWDGCRWRLDDTGAAVRLAKQATRGLYDWATREIQRISAELKQNGASEELPVQLKKAHDAQKWALKSEDANRIGAALDLARSEPVIPVLHDDLDRDVYLLNCPNGTLDLRTGMLRDHDRQDLLTKLCPTPYDPDAKCPTFLMFLGAIFKGDENLIGFVTRLLGMSLTGNISEQILPIFWGCGANGKSVLINTILEVMGGDYAMKANADLLMQSRGDRHPTELAQLFGMRLVVCSETHQGRHLNEALVKDLTGGEPIRARRMREDFWQFMPTHKVILISNHKPRVIGTDDGIWRRLRLTPFEERFWDPDEPESKIKELPPERMQDKRLGEKLRTEAPGILAWQVQGCLDWRRDGLTLPEKVRAATSEYRDSEDTVAQFIADRCETGDLVSPCRASALYAAYRAWAEASSEKPMSQRKFGEAMTTRGFERKTSDGTVYLGITLAGDTNVPI